MSESLCTVRAITAFAVSPNREYIAAGEQMAGDFLPQASFLSIHIHNCVYDICLG